MTSTPVFDLSFPFISQGLPGVGGRTKARYEDFIVEEISSIDPSGIGDHLYVSVTKEGITTRDVQLRLAGIFKLKPLKVASAGLKDKDARATQMFSLNLEGNRVDPEDALRLIAERSSVKANWAKYHDVKYRTGHMIGNRFKVLVSDLGASREKAVNRVSDVTRVINQRGLPNYYGVQRLGRRGKNSKTGYDVLFNGKRIRNRWLTRYLISAYQSYLCNRYISERVDRGLFGEVLTGDIVENHKTGKRHTVDDFDKYRSKHLSKELSFTAPMFGSKMSHPTGDSQKLEQMIYDESGLSNKVLKKNNVSGSRRLGRVFPEISYKPMKRGIEFIFTLPKGSFATTLIREYTKNA